MGFFDALFGAKQPERIEVAAERIWLTTGAKFAGVAQDVAQRSGSETVAILLVAHFPDVLARLNEIAATPASVPVMAVLASDLSVEIATSLNLDESATIDIIVAERHPLPSVDERLEQFARELPCRCRFAHHLSLEDPVIKIFAGQWVHGMLEKMGMKEDESLESPMVSRRIKHAQQKIEGRAYGDSVAESAERWLEKNCPDVVAK